MKYQVLGPRILIKVKRKQGVFIMSEGDIMSQTIGEVVQLGNEAYQKTDGIPWIKIGDSVHFQRYGAVRLASSDSDAAEEYWVINDKDILVIEAIENV